MERGEAPGSPRRDKPRAPAVFSPSPSKGWGQRRDGFPACRAVAQGYFPLFYVPLEFFPSCSLQVPGKVAQCQPLMGLHHSLPCHIARGHPGGPNMPQLMLSPHAQGQRDQDLPGC